ncbi:uncharacterized protein METZ01_LOCUS403556 [marine metagenome]|uniref:Uncharacterized protein n=1 Tax=marine metagenome TaxID=408172 RepID=A0A382VW01_9ZZZZ
MPQFLNYNPDWTDKQSILTRNALLLWSAPRQTVEYGSIRPTRDYHESAEFAALRKKSPPGL